MNHSELINTIDNYLDYHKFSKNEFCRIFNISIECLNKIYNKQHYVSLDDYKKLAFILDVDLASVITF